MSIEILNVKTVYAKKGKPPVINVEIKGRINFSVEAVKLLELLPGDKISFGFHSEDKDIIFFWKDPINGFSFSTQKTKESMRLSIYSRGLTAKIATQLFLKSCHSFGLKKETVDFNATKAWYIKK